MCQKEKGKETFPGSCQLHARGLRERLKPAVQPERPQILGTRLGSKEAKESKEQAAQTPSPALGGPETRMGLGEGGQGFQPQASSVRPRAAHTGHPRGWDRGVVSCLGAEGI